LLLNLLDLRVIVNDRLIYHIKPGASLSLSINAPQQVTMVFTNGFHITPRLQVPLLPGKKARLFVGCLLDDDMLLAGGLLTALFIAVGLVSNLLAAKFFSFGPVLYGLYLFYLKRKLFLQVKFLNQNE
jgi:hypothetical protein